MASFQTKIFLLVSLCCWTLVCSDASEAKDENAIAELKAIGDKVTSVVSKTMPACVAVNDGTGFGSGVIISPDGLVLTAAHVMVNRGPYELILPSGRTVKAKPLG